MICEMRTNHSTGRELTAKRLVCYKSAKLVACASSANRVLLLQLAGFDVAVLERGSIDARAGSASLLTILHPLWGNRSAFGVVLRDALILGSGA